MMNVKSKMFSIAFALILSGSAHAGLINGFQLDTPILGGNFYVANDGLVEATFLGGHANYFNSLFLDSPSNFGATQIFDKDSGVGTKINLGYFNAGDELIFRLDVRDTGLSYFVGDGSLNPDNLAHVTAVTSLAGGKYTTTAGFEDLFGGGDFDYDDLMFSLSNVIDPVHNVPEPAMGLLLCSGLLSLALGHRRKRISAS